MNQFIIFIIISVLLVSLYMFRHKAWVKQVLLLDFFRGLAITIRYFFRPKVTVQYPEEQTPISPPFSWYASASSLSERGRKMYRL